MYKSTCLSFGEELSCQQNPKGDVYWSAQLQWHALGQVVTCKAYLKLLSYLKQIWSPDTLNRTWDKILITFIEIKLTHFTNKSGTKFTISFVCVFVHWLFVMFLSQNLNPYPNKPWFLHVYSKRYFENTEGKGETARNEQFLLFPQCFLPIWTTICYFYQFRNCRPQTLSVWKSVKFVVWERVKDLQNDDILDLSGLKKVRQSDWDSTEQIWD